MIDSCQEQYNTICFVRRDVKVLPHFDMLWDSFCSMPWLHAVPLYLFHWWCGKWCFLWDAVQSAVSSTVYLHPLLLQWDLVFSPHHTTMKQQEGRDIIPILSNSAQTATKASGNIYKYIIGWGWSQSVYFSMISNSSRDSWIPACKATGCIFFTFTNRMFHEFRK